MIVAKIGSFGEVIFQVSPKKTQTFSDFQRNGSAKWDDHEVIGHKAISEFNSPGLEEITMTILFKAELGVNPIKQLEILRAMRDMGKVASFILGGKPISKNYWSIQSLTESHKVIDQKGNILEAELNITLREYYVKQKKAKKKTVKSTKKETSTKSKKALGKMTITVKSVHIRSGPSTSAKVIGYAFKGDSLTVLSEKNGWYSLGQGKYITSSSSYSTLKKG